MATRDEGMDDGERMRAALARLTGNERECLRRRLLPQTAKEMAIELGISPHAVEKRLKMARAKLGVGSSLHAARLLAAAEGYGATVPGPPDLPDAGRAGQDEAAAPGVPRRRRLPPVVLAVGAVSMILVATLLALVSRTPQAVPAVNGTAGADDPVLVLPAGSPGPHIAGSPAPESAADIAMRRAGPDEVAAFARSSFGTMDKDGSGSIEPREAPVAGIGDVDEQPGRRRPARAKTTRWAIGPRAQARWIALMDRDGDGRVSGPEYVAFESRVWRDHVPANWAWRH